FGPGYEVRSWFPGLAFETPVLALQTPDASDERIFVLEQSGRLWVIPPGAAKRELALDIADRLYFRGEAGAVGLAFHPDFGRDGGDRGDLFLFYVIQRDGVVYDRVARFAWRD